MGPPTGPKKGKGKKLGSKVRKGKPGSKLRKKGSKSKVKGSKSKTSLKAGKSAIKTGSKLKAMKKSGSTVKTGSTVKSAPLKSSSTPGATATPAAISPPTPEVIAKNQQQLEKIMSLLDGLKPGQVTRGSKDDLDKVQQLIKNIVFRDYGEMSRVRDVSLTESQKAIIKLVCGAGGVAFEDADTLAVTITDASGGSPKTPPPPPPDAAAAAGKINFPFEKLEFVQTKA